MANLTIAVQNAVPWHQRGVVTSNSQFFRSIGQAIGVAALGAVFNLQMGTRLGAVGQDLAIANAVLDPLDRRALDPSVLSGVRGILDGSLHVVFVILVVSAVANVLIAAQLPGGSPDEHAWKPRPGVKAPGTEPSGARSGA